MRYRFWNLLFIELPRRQVLALALCSQGRPANLGHPGSRSERLCFLRVYHRNKYSIVSLNLSRRTVVL